MPTLSKRLGDVPAFLVRGGIGDGPHEVQCHDHGGRGPVRGLTLHPLDQLAQVADAGTAPRLQGLQAGDDREHVVGLDEATAAVRQRDATAQRPERAGDRGRDGGDRLLRRGEPLGRPVAGGKASVVTTPAGPRWPVAYAGTLAT